MITQACLCNREEVKTALDIKTTARADRAVDRHIEAATDAVQRLCHRTFQPSRATLEFDYPDGSYSQPWILRLDEHEIISLSALTAGGVDLSVDDLLLEPAKDGPPYSSIVVDLSTNAAFAAGATAQRAISATGVWGYRLNMVAVTTLGEVLDSTETGVDVADSTEIGCGDLLQVDSEWMVVTGRQMLDTGVNIDPGDSLTAQVNDQTITLSTLTGAPAIDETILIGAERMLITDLAGSVAVVKRGWDGTTPAAHAGGSDIYAPRTLTVLRGQRGTTAAAHSNGATVYRHFVPPAVRALAVGEALSGLLQEPTGWARTAGSGESEREVSGRSLNVLRDQCYDAHGRGGRKWAI